MKSILLLLFSLLSTIGFSQKKIRASGVNLKIGVNSTKVDLSKGKLLDTCRSGYQIGLDGIFHEQHFLIQAGVHLWMVPYNETPFKTVVKSAFKRDGDRYDYGIKIPVRLGFYLLNFEGFRIKVGAGVFGILFSDKVISKLPEKKYSTRLTSGWTLNGGIFINPIILEIDYDSSFGELETKDAYKMRCATLSVGIFF